MSRQSETLDSDDILLKKPLGILFWLALGWVGLVVVLAVIANLLPAAQPRLPELLRRQRPARASTTCWAPTTWAATC